VVVRTRPRPISTRPTVSVVVPCYNYGHYLRDCVGSITAQPGVEVEVLIVDDASPDGSVAVARELAAEDPRVRVLEHETNRGHIATYNDGLAAVDGAYVVLLSADDLLAPGALGRATALMEARPDLAFVYGYSPEFSQRPPAPVTQVRSWSVWDSPEWLARVCRRGSNFAFCPEVVMRGTVMKELVGYDARLPHSADFLLWLRAAARGAVGRVDGPDQAYYRVHGANMHLQKYAGVLTDMRERVRAFEIFFAEHERDLPGGADLRAQSTRAVAREALAVACRCLDGSPAAPQPGGEEDRLAEELADFAEHIWPAVRSDRLWAAYERRIVRRKNGRRPSLDQRAAAVADDIAARIRWRRWRRYGV
jgi:Glycosyl transferase family 2